MADILNAAPMVVDQGTRDFSTRVVPQVPLDIPQHLPKFYTFAEKGPIGPTYIDFDNVSLTQVYGDATFDITSKYYNHQTPFIQTTAAAGNNCVIHRLVAEDAKDVANLALYLDVLPVSVPLYVKNTDGSLQLDGGNNPIPVLDEEDDPVTVAGFKVSWVLDRVVADIGEYGRGTLTSRNGIQTSGMTQSTQYPIFEFAASSPGDLGNKLALRLYAGLKTDLVTFPDTLFHEGKLYPYYIQLVKLVDTISGKTNPVLNSFGSQYARFVAKKDATDPTSGAVVDITKVVTDQYINLPTELETGLGTVYVYNSNLNTLLTSLYNAEKVVADAHRDEEISTTALNLYALNFMSFTSSNGSPYQAIKVVDIAGGVRLTRNTNLFLGGSSDGTISDAIMDTLVAADLDEYNNNLHEYNDQVLHPESMIYDSGFTLDTKKAIMKFISRRKDTFIQLSTYAHNAPASSLAEMYSVGVALKTMVELYPESATFGTPVMRATINMGSGYIINSLYTKRVPLTYAIAAKSARLMGARNGAWKDGFLFDRAPLSIITELRDLDVSWIPASTRNTLWSAGLNFALNYKIRSQFLPAIQTVYENDTSVLNSYFTAVAISYLNKVAHAAWREFSGSISLTNAQLIERVNTFVANQVKDKFAGLFVIRPNCTVTELDALRGYSWTLDIAIYSNNMKTVMTTHVSSFRLSDLAE